MIIIPRAGRTLIGHYRHLLRNPIVGMALLAVAWGAPALANSTIRHTVSIAELLLARDDGLRILANGFDADSNPVGDQGLESALSTRVAGSRVGRAGDMFGRDLDRDDDADRAALDPGSNDPVIPTLEDIKRADRVAPSDVRRRIAAVTQSDTAFDDGTEDDAGPATAMHPDGVASGPSADDSSTLQTMLLGLLGVGVVALAGLTGRTIMLRRVKALKYSKLPSRLLGERRR